MHDAADALTASVAPRVSTALHSAAKSVEPAASAKTGIRRLLDWRVLLGVGAVVVAAGAAAAMAMRQRYETATLAAKDAAENVADKADEVAGKMSDKAEEASRRPEVNGRLPHGVHK
jgi:anti-sigma-K factor RskA